MSDADRIRGDAGLTVRVEQDGEELVVSAVGELDLVNAPTLEAALRKAIAGDASRVILDLGGVTFVDSAGLRLVLVMAKQSLRNGGRLHLLRGSAPVGRVVEASGVRHFLPPDA